MLARLLPDRNESQPAGGDQPGLVKQQLFGTVLGLLAELAVASPVLLILEDLHWADQSTRDLLTFLSRMLHSDRIAVVATYRSDDMHRRHPLRPLVAELLRLPSVSSVELGPLDPSAMAEHLTTLSDRQLDAAAIGSMITRAEGNAYYAEELLTATAGTAAAHARLPSGLADLLLARVERLSQPAQQVLRTAAVTGRQVDDELVWRASGLDEASYEAAVREAVAHQLLVPHGEQGYSFRHALLREAVYADLLPGERTRLHARLAELLADEQRLAECPGTAAELAQHYLASHDIAGAFTASVLAGREAERLAAPAEAHAHYDQALSLWERVSDPEKLAGIGRGKLALKSALSAADGGDLARAAGQLRRLLGYLGPDTDPAPVCRVHERLAYFLNDIGEDAAAVTAAQAAVDALPADPPRWEHAAALATHARALLTLPHHGPAAARAEQAIKAAGAAGAPWVEADALVTLGLINEMAGNISAAIDLFTTAHRQAAQAKVLGVELRATFQLARVQLEQGDLDGSSRTAHQGTARAQGAGLGLAQYGIDLQYLHYLAHFADGDWDHAQEIANGFTVRVTSVAEARLSAMALFISVARGLQDVTERRRWLEPMLARDDFTEYIARGLLAEHAYWQGDAATAVTQAHAAIRAATDVEAGHFGPPVVRAAAIGLSALADQAELARAGGDLDRVAGLLAQADELLHVAREGAAYRRRPGFALGVDGQGWLARAEAEAQRARGENDPAAWRAVVAAFGPAVLARGAPSPGPPAVLAGGDDPPDPPAVLAGGDDPPNPPRICVRDRAGALAARGGPSRGRGPRSCQSAMVARRTGG